MVCIKLNNLQGFYDIFNVIFTFSRNLIGIGEIINVTPHAVFKSNKILIL